MFVRFNQRLALGWILLGGLSLLPGFGLTASAETVFQEGPNWLQLAPIEPGAQPNSDAAGLSQTQVTDALGNISVRLDASRFRGLFSRRKQDPIPLFSEATLEQLAQPLTDAINRAGPQRDLLLQVSQSRRQGAGLSGLLQDNRLTSARIFHRNEQLHVILGAVEQDPKASESKTLNNNPKASSYSQFTDQAEIPMGSRTAKAELAAHLSSNLALDSPPRGRSDWLVLDLSGLATEASSVAPQSQQTPPPPARSQTKPVAQTAPQALEAMDPKTLEQLRELRELKRRDLITDELYETLVRELLDGAQTD
ncbi:hypothetical protein [Marinimicrobium sp. C2-29]|uniref:hypothetical protein n=1 Tax=Marinimicrobium sp. C2-29 TaxID=3139825 RepID=UPI003138F2FC